MDDEHQKDEFIAALTRLGGAAGNGKLRETLGWTKSVYDDVKQELIDGAVKSRFLMRVGWVIIVHVYFTRPTDRRIV